MKTTYVLMIEDQKEGKVDAIMNGADACSVFIEASSLQEAKRLIKKGEQAAAAAMEKMKRKPSLSDYLDTLLIPPRALRRMRVGYRLGIDWITIER